MKVFFLIFSFFMLSLSCFPCSDGEECNVKEATNISAIDNHDQHNHESEACTPFCTCSCCAISTFYSNAVKTQTANIVFTSAKYRLYNIDFNTDVYYSIWQPPKIA